MQRLTNQKRQKDFPSQIPQKKSRNRGTATVTSLADGMKDEVPGMAIPQQGTSIVTSVADGMKDEGHAPEMPQQLTTPQKATMPEIVEETPEREHEHRTVAMQSPDLFNDYKDNSDTDDSCIIENSVVESQSGEAPSQQFAENHPPESMSEEPSTISVGTSATQIDPSVDQPEDCGVVDSSMPTEDEERHEAANSPREIIYSALDGGRLEDAVGSIRYLGQNGVLHKSGECKIPNITTDHSSKTNFTMTVADIVGGISPSHMRDVIPELTDDIRCVYARASVDGKRLVEHCEGTIDPGK